MVFEFRWCRHHLDCGLRGEEILLRPLAALFSCHLFSLSVSECMGLAPQPEVQVFAFLPQNEGKDGVVLSAFHTRSKFAFGGGPPNHHPPQVRILTSFCPFLLQGVDNEGGIGLISAFYMLQVAGD